MKPSGSALVKDGPKGWLHFTRPLRVHCAHSHAEVRSVVSDVEAAARRGSHCVGYISYEAAPAFDAALPAKKTSAPLVWFQEYRSCRERSELPRTRSTFSLELKRVGLTRSAYRKRIAAIKKLLKAGATYQVNFTFPLFLQLSGDPFALFSQLQSNQQSDYSVFIDTGDRTICSVSPELFFWKQGQTIESRPMKGTAARRPDPVQDAAVAAALQASSKNNAENVMIVDMIRNDLGKIAAAGSVCVSSLFAVERYPTVYQATSTVRGRTRASLLESLDALFPCASVTGAPKVETMKIIQDLERNPRGVYTGAIGYVSPNRTSFNVGIRTLDIARDGSAIYGTGSGIVWESDADSEYDECIAKASVLFAGRTPFDLLETMFWERGRGYRLSSEHVNRLCRSAAYFGYPTTKAAVKRELAAFASDLKRDSRVRLLLSSTGKIKLQAKVMAPGRVPWRVGIATCHVESHDVFVYHKTTQRAVYDAALAEDPTKDDMLLFNERGELTESCKANVVVVLGKTHFTPPVSSGLLAGTLRERMVKEGVIRERVLTRKDLVKARSVYLINSVRGRISIVLEGIN